APVVRVLAGVGDVDLVAARPPGRRLDIERPVDGAELAELRGVPGAHRALGGAEVQHEDLLAGYAADRGEVALDQDVVPARGQLLVVDLRVVGLHARVDVVPGHGQVQVAVVLAGARVQAGVVGVGAAAVDALEEAADQQVAVGRQDGLDLAARVGLERGDDVPAGRVDLGDVLDRGAAHQGELPADVGVGAAAAGEGDRVDLTVDVRGPRGDRVRGRVAEAEHVVPGECLGP